MRLWTRNWANHGPENGDTPRKRLKVKEFYDGFRRVTRAISPEMEPSRSLEIIENTGESSGSPGSLAGFALLFAPQNANFLHYKRR